MPKLLIEEGGQASVFELFEDEVTIGRGASNAVQVVDGHASKHHASLRQIAGRTKLVDLESKNGTRVNGAFANQRWLVHGDTVEIGDAKLTFDASDVAPARAATGASRTPGRVPGTVAAAPAAAAPAAPRPRAAAARAGGVERRPRRPRDEEYEDDEEEVRGVPKRGGNSVLIGVAIGGGLVLAVLLFFLIGSGSTAGANAVALSRAKGLVKEGKQEDALHYLERFGDPSDVDGYRSVKEEMESLKRQIALAAVQADTEDAEKAYSMLVRYKIELHKQDHSKEQLAADAREFCQKYMGTPAVEKLLDNSVEDMPAKIREIMGEKPAYEVMREIWNDYEKWSNQLFRDHQPADSPNPALGGRLIEFQTKFAGTMKVLELERSPRDPYPALRRIAGIK